MLLSYFEAGNLDNSKLLLNHFNSQDDSKQPIVLNYDGLGVLPVTSITLNRSKTGKWRLQMRNKLKFSLAK